MKQADRDGVARLLRRAFEFGELLAVEPLQREQAARGQLLMHARHAHEGNVGEHQSVELRDLRLAVIVELLAHALANLARDLARVDRGADAPMQREDEIELREIRLHRRGHLRILQLAREVLAVEAFGAMHLSERSGGRGLQVELRETFAPVRPKLRLHPPPHEARTHRRRLRLKFHELGRVVGGQRVGNGREQLPDLHDRPLHGAERGNERLGVALGAAAAQAIDAEPGGESPRADAETRIAGGAGAQAVGFLVAAQAKLLMEMCSAYRVRIASMQRRVMTDERRPSRIRRGGSGPGNARRSHPK